jgi:hypothetical protein
MGYLHQVSVTFQGKPIGHLEIAERSPAKILGRFIPGGAFEQNRPLFDEARRLADLFDKSHDSDSLDYTAFDQYVDAIKRLTPMIAFPELPVEIEEFAVDQELRVEVTLANAVV